MIGSRSTGREGEDIAIFANSAATSILRSPRTSADALFSAIDLAATIKLCRRLRNGIFDPYRPELHYMRGPGPKWREKHARNDTASSTR